ncbi:hypothetical protein GQ53DRAFT_804686 [Thozetella sp. PMI_491]|nr:hypothetical protein GQ53DRAFT_804686 [Thozetella sp. PMI_491]
MAPHAARKEKALTKREQSMFAGMTFAIVGDFTPKFQETTIGKYIQLRGGKILPRWDSTVTHLICSQGEWKKKSRHAGLKGARRNRKCHILMMDWLELSMINRKKLPEKEYSFLSREAYDRAKERAKEKKEKGIREETDGFVNTNTYRPYADLTHFIYDVKLLREKDGARYDLSLFESIAQPPLYRVGVKFYRKKHAPALRWVDDELPGSFQDHFEKFKHFFKVKTTVEWDHRLVKAGIANDDIFHYAPPTGGKPVGYVPDEFKPPEEPDCEQESGRGLAEVCTT